MDVRLAHPPVVQRFRPHRDAGRPVRSADGSLASRLPVPLVELDYEETISEFEPTARRLIAACGLDWDPACLEFYRNERPVRTASLTQVRQPIYNGSVARWKNYEPEMENCLPAFRRIYRRMKERKSGAAPKLHHHRARLRHAVVRPNG